MSKSFLFFYSLIILSKAREIILFKDICLSSAVNAFCGSNLESTIVTNIAACFSKIANVVEFVCKFFVPALNASKSNPFLFY